MTAALQASYDELPYQSYPFAQTHPDRLATLGLLFGFAPAPIERCRVLEIGCTSGGNLIPVAAMLPHSEFVGTDFSAVQIRDGTADVAALGLGNIRLLQMDIRDLGTELGSFDYIVAHGVYSWVPDDVQEKVLAQSAHQLSPNGIAKLFPERVFALCIASRAQPASEVPDERSLATEEFRALDGSRMTTQRPLTKAAMIVLARYSPAAIAFDELCRLANSRLGAQGTVAADARNGLASDLLQCFAAGVVELHATPSPFAIDAGGRPEAGAVVRLQASRGAQVTNLRHESITLDDDARRLLGLLDGTRTQERIAAVLWPEEQSALALGKLQPALAQIARQAFLVR